jgi:hypothetical protein
MSRWGAVSSAISCDTTTVQSLITVTTTTLFKSSSALIILLDQSRIQGREARGTELGVREAWSLSAVRLGSPGRSCWPQEEALLLRGQWHRRASS